MRKRHKRLTQVAPGPDGLPVLIATRFYEGLATIYADVACDEPDETRHLELINKRVGDLLTSEPITITPERHALLVSDPRFAFFRKFLHEKIGERFLTHGVSTARTKLIQMCKGESSVAAERAARGILSEAREEQRVDAEREERLKLSELEHISDADLVKLLHLSGELLDLAKKESKKLPE